MGRWFHPVLFRLVLLWLPVITADVLRVTSDGFEDSTTQGLPAILGAAALVATAYAVIGASAGRHALRPQHRVLRAVALALWLMDLITLVMRNTGGRHPDDYLLGWIFVLGMAAATATVCLAILVTDHGDKARLIRALAATREQCASEFETHLLAADASSLPRSR